jgi:uncharacterized membrane protein (Fun14 family)
MSRRVRKAIENGTMIFDEKLAITLGGGFFVGILIGYALKKVVKVVVGLFFAGLAYLQYQQIVAINWNKVLQLSHNVVAALANATNQMPGFNSGHLADIAMSNFGIPLTGRHLIILVPPTCVLRNILSPQCATMSHRLPL